MGGAGVNFALRLGSTAVLARFLIPEHFGLISMVTALTSIAENFKDLGLSTATVQKKDITHEQVSTLFWVNALVGVVIMALLSCFSASIAWFYGDKRLIWITIALSTSFFWGGMTVQHQAILWRKMQFFTLAAVNLGATLLSIIVAILLALKGYGFWALVWRDVSRSCFFAVGVWLVCPWLPGLPRRSKNISKMIQMGGDITVFNLITFFTDSLDFILVGKYSGAGPLGIYRQATQLALLPVGFLTDPVRTVAQPALRILQNEPPRYRKYYERILKSLSFVSMPIMVFLFIYAHDIILIILGRKWIQAVVIFKVFALAGFIRPVISTVGFIMITCGWTRRYLFLGVINSVGIIVAIGVGIRWGAEGVAIGHVLANYVFFLPVAYIALKDSPASVGLFLSSIFPSVICSLTLGLVLTVFSSLSPIHNPYYTIAAALPIAIVSYLAAWMVIPQGRLKLREMFSDFTSMFGPSGKGRELV